VNRLRGAGDALLALQLALVAALAGAAAPEFLAARAPALAWLLALAGVALGAWSLHANRPGNFSIRPLPLVGARFVQSGPYRFVRHPMYSTVLLCALACLAARPLAWVRAAVLTLAGVLAGKAALEERWMSERFPAYADYRRRTRRFLPGLY
jgi:protein-S-isoprenylcysteine O-methyltransferase Ste14